jgi:hypothetical protein
VQFTVAISGSGKDIAVAMTAFPKEANMQIFHRSLPIRMASLQRALIVTAVLGTVLMLPSISWADSCGAIISLNNTTPQVTCVMPNTGSQNSMTVGMKYMSFSTQAQGSVLVYSDSTHTSLNDVITFENVNGMATIVFSSSLTGGLTAPDGPILGTYTSDQSFIFLSLALTNGKVMHAGICTDAGGGTACNGGPDSIRLSVGNVPEPGTFMLLGSGVLGYGAWGLAAGSRAKRLLGFKG